MTGPSPAFESLSSAALLAATRDLVRKSQGVEAREIEELVARLAPRPPAVALVRKLPERPEARASTTT